MDDVYDLSQMTRSLKTNEKMIAFAGFSIDQDHQPSKEGVLKISSFLRPDGSGYLTLTFIMDIEGDAQIQERLTSLFFNVDENTIRPFFKEAFETVLRCPMDGLSKTPSWHFEEINIYFRFLKGKECQIIELNLVPALEKILPFHFDSIEWWEQPPFKTDAVASPASKNSIEAGSLKSAVIQWFRSI